MGIPFAAGGGVLALYFSGLNFSISAAVGFISLFGVSVMNGILVMTYYNETRATGLGTIDAMFHAASQRMRPMLMTALSACIGLLPAAVSTGIGSQVQRPLATSSSAACSSGRSFCWWSCRRSRHGPRPGGRYDAGRRAGSVATGRVSATEDIDTRITVQPHGPPAGKPGRVGGATNPIVPLKLINPHRRTFSPSRAANRFAPNASGIPGASASKRATKFRRAFRIPRSRAETCDWRDGRSRGRRRWAREARKHSRAPTNSSVDRHFPSSRRFEDAHSRRHRRRKLKPSRRRIGHCWHRRPGAHGDRHQRNIGARDSLEFESSSNLEFPFPRQPANFRIRPRPPCLRIVQTKCAYG
jgi:hypothetical protein